MPAGKNKKRKKQNLEEDIKLSREKRRDKLSALNDYVTDYNVDKLIGDLVSYFDGEVDFDLPRLKEIASQTGFMDDLVNRAKSKNTHPVIEFIQEIIKISTKG